MNIGNVLSDFIQGNPFSTPVGVLIEEATEDFVSGELWQLFSGVCQAINQSATGPKDAVRAFRRRFSDSAQSNNIVAYHTLLLLETCVLNCGYRFLVALATKDSLKDFARFVTKNADSVPERVRNKLLSLFQTWALKHGNHIDLREFSSIYAELKSQGVQFPDNVPDSETNHRTTPSVSTDSTTQPPSTTVTHITEPSGSLEQTFTVPSPNQKSSKLSTDLAQVRVNICVLSDLVSDAELSEPDEEAKLLMTQLAESLHQMSDRLIQAVSAWETYQETLPNRETSDATLLEMLNVSDELHTVLMRHNRVMQSSTTTITNVSKDTAASSETEQNHATHSNSAAEFGSFIGERSDGDTALDPTHDLSQAIANDLNLHLPETEDKSKDGDHSLIDF